jgi:hypothetical protein
VPNNLLEKEFYAEYYLTMAVANSDYKEAIASIYPKSSYTINNYIEKNFK